ncbi:hypothetical protein ACGFZ9_36425 [Streptomyces mirabilis]|uniref:hypothetical protein n=1 Tax=Streptomyces mirabilis TaxID=68239 RepID=UPI00371BD896
MAAYARWEDVSFQEAIETLDAGELQSVNLGLVVAPHRYEPVQSQGSVVLAIGEE